MSARAGWNDIDSGFPAAGSAQEKLAYILKVVTASSAVEAWRGLRYRVAENYIELCANFESEPGDPDAREPIIACGDALFRIKLALKCFGCLGAVELFPDLGNAELIARIHFGGGGGQDEQEFRLLKAMVGPAGSSYAAEHTAGVFKALMSATAIGPAWLEFTEAESSRNLLLRFARAEIPPATPQKTGQVGWWPEENALSTSAKQGLNRVEMAVLKTKTDDKHGWLATGKAKARVQLQARLCGVPVAIFCCAFRSKCSREQLRTTIGRKGFVQAIVGFGLSTTHLGCGSVCQPKPHTDLDVSAHPPVGHWLANVLRFWIKPYQRAPGKPPLRSAVA